MSVRWIWVMLALLAPARLWAWGNDGHWLVLESALNALPADVKRIYAGRWEALKRATVEPDKHSSVPTEGCKHYLNIEKLDPSYLTSLKAALDRTYGGEGFADEDARGLAAGIERPLFARRPPPWSEEETGPLWERVPPTLTSFRKRYGHMEIFIGTVVYQPLLYTRALSRAIVKGDSRWIAKHAGYLAHYVGDLHVPLHVTSNYKGQYSGNPAFGDRRRSHGTVHARFEIGHLRAHLESLKRDVARACRVAQPVQPDRITPRAIAAAREAYRLAEGLMKADRDAARQADPQRSWSRYLKAVSPAFKPVTTRQLTAASVMLADLLLTASQGNLLAPPASYE